MSLTTGGICKCDPSDPKSLHGSTIQEIFAQADNKCWFCQSPRPRVSCVIRQNDRMLPDLKANHLLPFHFPLDSTSNSIALCPNCASNAWETHPTDPLLVIVPTDLKYFINHETHDYARREGFAKQRLRMNMSACDPGRSIPSAADYLAYQQRAGRVGSTEKRGGLYTPIILGDWLSPYIPAQQTRGEVGLDSEILKPRPWHGEPLAMIRRAIMALGSLRIRRMPPETFENLYQLRNLYGRPAPEPSLDAWARDIPPLTLSSSSSVAPAATRSDASVRPVSSMPPLTSLNPATRSDTLRKPAPATEPFALSAQVPPLENDVLSIPSSLSSLARVTNRTAGAGVGAAADNGACPSANAGAAVELGTRAGIKRLFVVDNDEDEGKNTENDDDGASLASSNSCPCSNPSPSPSPSSSPNPSVSSSSRSETEFGDRTITPTPKTSTAAVPHARGQPPSKMARFGFGRGRQEKIIDFSVPPVPGLQALDRNPASSTQGTVDFRLYRPDYPPASMSAFDGPFPFSNSQTQFGSQGQG